MRDAQTTQFKTSFGKRLRQLRARRGLSQEELANRANLHRTYVSDCERGERNPSLVSIRALAQGLEVHPGELLKDPDDADDSAR